jgi:hypothetical protein
MRSSHVVQGFPDLHGLDDVSDDQIAEHRQLCAGYVRPVNTLGDQLDVLPARGHAAAPDLVNAALQVAQHWRGNRAAVEGSSHAGLDRSAGAREPSDETTMPPDFATALPLPTPQFPAAAPHGVAGR